MNAGRFLMNKGTILVVDDEKKIVSFVGAYLQREGFDVVAAHDGEAALRLWREHEPMLILLDLMLPKVAGLDVCREVRAASHVPIIMLTAKDSEADKIVGLELGADDYLTKPFSPRELVARVRAVLRRTHARAETPAHNVVIGTLAIDRSGREVTVDGARTHLTRIEFDILDLLVSNRGRVLARKEILKELWGENYFGDNRVVDVHIRRLREKVEEDPSQPRFIHTIWGVGYKFEVED